MPLSKKGKASVKADDILTNLLTEIADIEFMIKNGTFEKFEQKKFWIKELNKRKNRLENQLIVAEQQMAGVEWPETLRQTFDLAKKRKSVVKGQMTKTQNRIKSKLKGYKNG